MISYFSQKKSEYDEYDSLIELIPKQQIFRAKALMIWGILVAIGGIVICAAAQEPGGIFVILLGLGMIAGTILININRKKNLAKNLERLPVVTDILEKHYQSYGMCLVGMEYSNPAILKEVKETILAGRADTPKEAINVMLDDLHKSNMEALAVATAISAEEAARGAKSAAGFAAASFFLK